MFDFWIEKYTKISCKLLTVNLQLKTHPQPLSRGELMKFHSEAEILNLKLKT